MQKRWPLVKLLTSRVIPTTPLIATPLKVLLTIAPVTHLKHLLRRVIGMLPQTAPSTHLVAPLLASIALPDKAIGLPTLITPRTNIGLMETKLLTP